MARLYISVNLIASWNYITALCHEHKGILVHKDPEFEKILPPIKDHKLPYKIF